MSAPRPPRRTRSARVPFPKAAAAPDAATPVPPDLEPVGRVQDSYGVNGWLKLQPFGPVADSVLLSCDDWWLRSQSGQSDGPTLMRIERSRVHGATVIAKAVGIADREAALAWRGAEVLVPRSRFPAPAEDEYYWVDLIGCEVRNREGAVLGSVGSVDDHGAHALLRVKPACGPEFLIPFVDAYVDGVDLAARRIDVDWQPDYL